MCYQRLSIGKPETTSEISRPAPISSKLKLNIDPSIFRNAFIQGGASRCAGQILLYPLDALRTLAQSRSHISLSDVGSKALLRGCVTTSSFALGMGAIQFSVFESLKHSTGPLLASMCGAASSCIISIPQEVIKQRLVTGIYPSFRVAVRSIAKEEGLTGFYSAWRPTMLRNVPFVAITFTSMHSIQRRLMMQKKEKGQLNTLENMGVGMMSALIAGVLTNPIDVVKTRMMTQASSNLAPYNSAIDCFLQISSKEGIGALYSGFQQRSIYMCGLWGITFAVNGYFNKLRHEKAIK